MPGNYRERLTDFTSCNVIDFDNPWNFHGLFMQPEPTVLAWLQDQGLIASSLECPKCQTDCYIANRSNRTDGKCFRCKNNRNHEYSIRKYSFFDRSHFAFQDIMMFIKTFLDGGTLLKCANFSGLDYKKTAVDWANFIRDLFRQYVNDTMSDLKFEDIVELDESLFGRKYKYHRGNPNKGTKVWIFGIIERSSNRIILYPVDKRDRDTLVPIIKKHVKPGSTIYSDGWAAYSTLNAEGFNHFSVIHKVGFKKVYKNESTEEEIEVHTNTIEGSWKHAKDHFRKINGTSLSNFEAHLSEVIWRNHTYREGNIYQSFFDLLKRYYTLTDAPSLDFNTPLFPTWSGGQSPEALRNSTIHRADTSDCLSESGDSDPDGGDNIYLDVRGVDYQTPGTSPASDGASGVNLSPVPQSPSAQPDIAPGIPKYTSTPCPPQADAQKAGPSGGCRPKAQGVRGAKEVVCCPKGFRAAESRTKPTKDRAEQKTRGRYNPYGKEAFVSKWTWTSSDSDFC